MKKADMTAKKKGRGGEKSATKEGDGQSAIRRKKRASNSKSQYQAENPGEDRRLLEEPVDI